MRFVVAALALTLSAPVFAQVISRPTDPPIVTAENDSWYRRGEPLLFAGDLYYPAGPQVFFDGNVMVRTGHYNGVPLYADATIAPYSIVFVPVGRGLMQPYERKRVGELAGTSGSRLSSFPGASAPSPRELPVAAGPPTNAPGVPASIDIFTPDLQPVGTMGAPSAMLATDAAPVAAQGRPVRRENVWVEYGGEKWVNAGSAVPIGSRALIRIGHLSGHPVYRPEGAAEDVIYVETSAGVVAPFRLASGQ